jgi:hypothetical protein
MVADLHRFVAHHCGALVHLGRNRPTVLDIEIDGGGRSWSRRICVLHVADL